MKCRGCIEGLASIDGESMAAAILELVRRHEQYGNLLEHLGQVLCIRCREA
jgi:hypothetical protein